MKKLLAALSIILVAGATFAVAAVVRDRERMATSPNPTADRSSSGAIARGQARLRANPGDDNAHALIALSALSRAKETGDSTWYRTAERSASAALAINPNNVPALDARATLANARHRFRDALDPAQRSRRLAPDRLAPLEALIDANIELGRYGSGFSLADERLRRRPDLASYSRASYVAELRGERDLAIRLMRLAADAARPGSADRAWARAHVGLLQFGSGQLAAAERELRGALAETPDDPAALAGLAKVVAARGDLTQSATLLRRSLALAPIAGVAEQLAEVEHAAGRAQAAADAAALAGDLNEREARNGVRLDLDTALADANVRRPGADVIARARRGRSERPGIVGDDALGWVLTRAGRCREGLEYARRSLRLGTRDAEMHFHAGMAARCAGHRAEARRHLGAALRLNPNFSPRWSPVARRALSELSGR